MDELPPPVEPDWLPEDLEVGDDVFDPARRHDTLEILEEGKQVWVGQSRGNDIRIILGTFEVCGGTADWYLQIVNRSGNIAVGVAKENCTVDPPESAWGHLPGYIADEYKLGLQLSQMGAGAVFGVHLDHDGHELSFSRNGVPLGHKIQVPDEPLRLACCMYTSVGGVTASRIRILASPCALPGKSAAKLF